jgi:rod shape-determining protein MreC
MESFLNRYRNITVLLLVIFAQLVLLAVQVKNDQDVRIIRLWAVSTVTPAARVVEWFRGGGTGFFRRYILLHDASEENRKLRDEVGRLRIENTFLRNEINTADRAKALQLFKSHTESKMLAANVISGTASTSAKVVFVNRGSSDGVMRGMGVVNPDGIVGKIIAAYPNVSEVLLVNDPEFSAGVVSQKSQSHGILKGQGNNPLCKVDYVPFEDKIEAGEWFFTSGDDRVFPRGFTVGLAKVVRPGAPFKEVLVEPSGVQHGVEDVLIILESIHQAIPDTPPVNQPVYIAPPPPASATPAPAQTTDAAGNPVQPAGTEADKLRTIYKSVGDSQNHVFGTGLPGSKPPDFTKLPTTPIPPKAAPAGAPGPNTPAAAPKNPATGTTGAGAPNAAPSKNPATPNGAANVNERQVPPAPTSAAPKPTPKSATDTTVAPRMQRQNATDTPAAPAKPPASPPKGPGGELRR